MIGAVADDRNGATATAEPQQPNFEVQKQDGSKENVGQKVVLDDVGKGAEEEEGKYDLANTVEKAGDSNDDEQQYESYYDEEEEEEEDSEPDDPKKRRQPNEDDDEINLEEIQRLQEQL